MKVGKKLYIFIEDKEDSRNESTSSYPFASRCFRTLQKMIHQKYPKSRLYFGKERWKPVLDIYTKDGYKTGDYQLLGWIYVSRLV